MYDEDSPHPDRLSFASAFDPPPPGEGVRVRGSTCASLVRQVVATSIDFSNSQEPSTLFFGRRGRACIPWLPSKNPRERSAGRRTVMSPRLVARGVLGEENAAPSGAPLAALTIRRSKWLSPRSALPGTRRAMSPPQSVPVQRAPRRAVIVPPGRVPGPLECVVTSHTREDRIPSRFHDVS